jgi:hypothetical protein
MFIAFAPVRYYFRILNEIVMKYHITTHWGGGGMNFIYSAWGSVC